jgi:hypothetical protein
MHRFAHPSEFNLPPIPLTGTRYGIRSHLGNFGGSDDQGAQDLSLDGAYGLRRRTLKTWYLYILARALSHKKNPYKLSVLSSEHLTFSAIIDMRSSSEGHLISSIPNRYSSADSASGY